MENFNFYHLSDLHLYAAKEIGSKGKNFDFKCATDQKCMAESAAIVDAAFDKLIADKENKVVVISGDLTFDGEKISHDVLVGKLQKLKEAGKKVYVTTATHDWNMHANRFDDDGITPVEKYTRQQLREVYNDFGWSDALSEHKGSYSYSVIPAKGIRFLLLNDDGDGLEFCGFYDDLLAWIKEQANEAKENGERVIAFTHHPVLPPSLIYPLFSHRDMLGNYETTAPFLADCGVEFIFTGHTHMQSVSCLDTPSGNKLYHINTGSVTAYPAPMRKVTVKEDGLDIKTLTIDSFDWDLGGKTTEEYMKEHFDFMLRDIFDSMENDIEHFKLLAKGFSLDAKVIEKLKHVFIAVGKIINRLKFKTLGKILFVSKEVDPIVADLKVRDFALDLISRMYSGDRCYTPDTAEYKAFMAFANKIGKKIELKDPATGDVVFIEDLVEDLLYDTGEFDNNNTFLSF
ncbi:MAG: metallophosphoesterase family protein [Acutalibacteraceae bacterium]